MKHTRIAVAIIAVLFLAGLVWAFNCPIYLFQFLPQPSDDTLTRSFLNGRQSQLEKLISMIGEDKKLGAIGESNIDCDSGYYYKCDRQWAHMDAAAYNHETGIEIEYVLVKSGLTYPRYQDYLNLLKKSGVQAVRKSEHGQIEFPVWQKFSNSADDDRHYISYVYCPDRPSRDLMSGTTTGADEKRSATEIAPGWFVQHKIYERKDQTYDPFASSLRSVEKKIMGF